MILGYYSILPTKSKGKLDSAAQFFRIFPTEGLEINIRF